jgi:hypothetical protein
MMPAARAAAAFCTLIVCVAAAGCNGLLDTSQDQADEAQLIVTGTSPVPLTVILSNQFQTVQDPTTGQITTSFIQADTLTLLLPIDQTYSLGASGRVYLRLWQPDSTQTADILMRVLLDKKREVYNQRATLKNAFLEYSFSYF